MNVTPLNRKFTEQIKTKIDNKTKPVGALGQLEAVALQLALIQNQNNEHLSEYISLNKPISIIFAGDHGIADQGVSIAPSVVTQQMVANFLQGGAAINCFCRSNGIELNVVDAGILVAVENAEHYPQLMTQRLGAGTENFAEKAAMTMTQVDQGFVYAEQLVQRYITQGSTILLLGEMGIGNTSSASALMAALTEFSTEQCVGKGTGISDEQLSHKLHLIKKALARFDSRDPKEVLRQVGGFEIVQMVGVILAAAKAKIAVVIDGFIVSAAALVAKCIDENVGDYLIFSHVSEEQGHQLLLRQLNAQPLLNLQLRLGEGTGAVLAYPLIKAAASFYNDMASFASAGVENVLETSQ